MKIRLAITAFVALAALVLFRGERVFALTKTIVAEESEYIAAPDATFTLEKELDDANEELAELEVTSDSFSILARVTIEEKGTERGNGDDLGMIYAVGSGWNDGYRLYYDWRSFRYSFQIGREQGAYGLNSNGVYPPGYVHEIVVIVDADAKKITMCVDGEFAGECALEIEPDIAGKTFKAGYVGMGVGSNKMFFDKIDYWKRALTLDDVRIRNIRRAFNELKIVKALNALAGSSVNAAPIGLVDDALAALEVGAPESAEEPLRNIVELSALDSGKVENVASDVLEKAREFLNAAPKSPEGEPTLYELKQYGDVISRLQLVARNSLASAEEANRLIWDIKLAYRREAAFFTKIDMFERSAERVRKIERDALETNKKATTRFNAATSKRIVYVSPNGDDASGSGTKAAPFASLARAFESLAQSNVKRQVTVVELQDGVYQVDRTATLKGVENVLVRPARGAKVVLTGGRSITNFKTLSGAAEDSEAIQKAFERFKPEVRERIFVANLAEEGVEDFGSLAPRGYGVGDKVAPIPSLYYKGESQTLARWPNENEENLKFGEKAEDSDSNDENNSVFKYDFDRPDGWSDLDDIWAFGLFQWEWAANLRQVVKIDRDKKQITFGYKDASGRFDYYFVNVLEELDAPGEYYVDKKNGLLYYYPPESTTADRLNRSKVEFDEFSDLFIKLEDANDVVIQGISFKLGRESFAAAINCNRCYVDSCTIEQFGGNVLTIKNGTFCGALNSRMREIGACGLRVSGGDRSALIPCNHIMHNNFISDFSRIDRVYAPAFSFTGCGAAVTNNLICDSPHHALRTDGNDIYVARNEVHSCVYEYSDQAGIDIYCDPTFRGIVIEKNLWRHIGSAFAICGQAGIRLDDSISGVLMLDNTFYRTSGGFFGAIQIHGGKDNLCKGNTIVNCKQAFSFTPWGNDRYAEFINEKFPQFVDSEVYRKAYPFVDEIRTNFNRNYILNNKAVNCGQFNVRGDEFNLFVGNVMDSAEPDLTDLGVVKEYENYDEAFYTNDVALKRWLSKLSGRSLNDVGLHGRWNGENLPVWPKFRAVTESEE